MSVPFVLGVAADMFGCGYHRVQCPAAWITQSGAGLANVTFGYPPVEKVGEMAPDAIICQRPRDENEIKILARLREDFGSKLKIIFEIDDLLTDVPEQNVHEAFQPPPEEVNANIARALSYCDWAVTATEPLKAWLHTLRPDIEVKVIPNYLPELDKDLPKIESPLGKARIGWGGSISHDGDLDLIIKTIEEVGDDQCQWVFLGHMPRADLAGRNIEYHSGVPPVEYLPLLMKQNLEMVLAPLEENPFNNAKSNLRLLQAGAIGAAVIASPIGPYLRDNPPVFAYAKTPEEFKEKTEEWLALPEKKKIYYRARMRNWAKKSYGVKANLPSICNAWGIANGRVGELPKGKKMNGHLVVHGSQETINISGSHEGIIWERDLNRAVVLAIKENAPLMVANSGVVVSQDSLKILIDTLKNDPNVASVCPMGNDGGVGISFLVPTNKPTFVSLDAESNKICEEVCRESNLAPRHVAFPLGPLVLMAPKALASLPKPGKYPWDWGFLAAITGKKNLFVPQAWANAAQPLNTPPIPWVEVRGLNFQAVQGAFNVEERVKLECAYVRKARTFLIGNGPGDAHTWVETFYPENENLEATSVKVIPFGHEYDLNEITETWVRFQGSETETRKGVDFYLERFGNSILYSNHNTIAVPGDVVYCDALAPNGGHFFKPPTFDKEWFLGLDYITACCLIKKDKLRAMNLPPIVNRAQLVGVMLELVKEDANFTHCPIPLYWEKGSIPDDVRLGMIKHIFPEYEGKVLMPGLVQTWRKLEASPSVSIVMLTTGKTWTLRQTLATLLKRTEYGGEWNILLGRCGERRGDPKTLSELNNPKVIYTEMGEDKFNWSKSNNELAKKANSDIIIFMNDDVLVTDKHWLNHMVAQVQQTDVGAVGIRLFYPGNGNLQHAGVYVGNGVAGHVAKNTPGNFPGYWGYGRITHECSAVTGAALAVRAKLFDELGGFDERMAVNYSDVDFCLKALKARYRNICVCSAEMMHAESSSRPHAMTEEWIEQIGREGKQLAVNHPGFIDPYWNPNLKVPVSANKWNIGGLNWDILTWDRDWNGASLILNDSDAELIIKTTWRGLKPILGAVERGRLVLLRPGLVNMPALEIIEKTLIREILVALGVTEIAGAGADTPEGKILRECLVPANPRGEGRGHGFSAANSNGEN